MLKLTDKQLHTLQANYHCGITSLLIVAYDIELSQRECGQCKMKYRFAHDWFNSLSEKQQIKVVAYLDTEP
jgi:hypothetical protein